MSIRNHLSTPGLSLKCSNVAKALESILAHEPTYGDMVGVPSGLIARILRRLKITPQTSLLPHLLLNRLIF